MEDNIINLIQHRMDKCGSEQFWAVAIITGLTAFIIKERNSIISILPDWILFSIISILISYAIFYILHRHHSYYVNAKALAEYVKDNPECPTILKYVKKPWSPLSLIGSTFYALWVLGAGILCIISII